MRERGFARCDTEGSGVGLPMGMRGTTLTRKTPMKTYSLNAGMAARRGQQGITVASLKRPLTAAETNPASSSGPVRTSRARRLQQQFQRDQTIPTNLNEIGNVGFDHSFSSTMMDASAATWGPAANRSVSASMDASAATWAGGQTRTRTMRRLSNDGSKNVKISGPVIAQQPFQGRVLKLQPPNVSGVAPLRRTNSAPLDQLRAAIRQPMAPVTRRNVDVHLDDLASVQSEEVEGEQDNHPGKSQHYNNTTSLLDEPALKRHASAPFGGLPNSPQHSMEEDEDDFFRQFQGVDSFGVPPVLDHTPTMEDFGQFSDVFGPEDAATHPWPDFPTDDTLVTTTKEETTATTSNTSSSTTQDEVGPIHPLDAGKRPLRRVKSAPKTVLHLAAERAKARLRDTSDRIIASRRSADETRIVNRCRSRSPCRLRRVQSNSNPGVPFVTAKTRTNEPKSQDGPLEARRRARRTQSMEFRPREEEESENDNSLAMASQSVPQHPDDEDRDYISPTSVSEFQERSAPGKHERGRTPLSPKARAKKGIEKIRNLMVISPKRDRTANASRSTTKDEATTKPGKLTSPKSPLSRRVSLQGIRDLVQSKIPFRQMAADADSSLSFGIPDLNKVEAETREQSKQLDDSTAGGSSSRLVQEETSGNGSHTKTNDDGQRQRKSRSSSHNNKKDSIPSVQKKTRRRSDDRPHPETSKNSQRKSSEKTRPHQETSVNLKRKSTERMEAHRKLASDGKKTTKISEGVIAPDRTSQKGKSKTDSKKASERRTSREQLERSSTSEPRRSSRNAHRKGRKSSTQTEDDANNSKLERSLNLSDLEMTDSSHGSLSASAQGSRGTSSSRSMSSSDGRHRRRRGSLSSSSRSASLDGSRSRNSSSGSSSGGDEQNHHKGESETTVASVAQAGTRACKSHSRMLHLDTVPETCNEDEYSEASSRITRTKVSLPEFPIERQLSVSSSIQSTAEVSDYEDEVSKNAPHRKSQGDEVACGERRPSKDERHSLSISDLRPEPFLPRLGELNGEKRHQLSDGELRHPGRSSGSVSVDPRESHYGRQPHSFGRPDTMPHWDNGFHGGAANYFHDPHLGPEGLYANTQSRCPKDVHPSNGRSPQPTIYRVNGFSGVHDNGRGVPFSNNGPRVSFPGEGRNLSRSGHVYDDHKWPHSPNTHNFDPKDEIGLVVKLMPRSRSKPELAGYKGDLFGVDRFRDGVDCSNKKKSGAGGGSSVREHVRRRHSIGSGHERESIVQRVTAATRRELKMRSCFRCSQIIANCQCVEPIIDISHHTRDDDDLHHHPRASATDLDPKSGHLGERLASSNHAVRRPSLYDTFGIRCGDPRLQARTTAAKMSRHDKNDPIDNAVHTEHPPLPHPYCFPRGPPPRPLYDRPADWDVNDYVPSNAARLAGVPTHRGRAMGGMIPSSGSTDNRGYRGTGRSFAVDDDSIRYPRRLSLESNQSRVDDGSGRSFAI